MRSNLRVKDSLRLERFRGETILSRKHCGYAFRSMTENPINGDRAPSTLAFLLSQVGIHASRQFAERIATAGLNPPLFRVLNLVDAAEGRSQQAIGQAIAVPASRMVALVDELEQEGLVERRPDPEDRRVRAL